MFTSTGKATQKYLVNFGHFAEDVITVFWCFHPSVIKDRKFGACFYHAICGVMEAKLWMRGVDVRLSVEFLEKAAKDMLNSLPDKSSFSDTITSVLSMLCLTGILTEEDYNKGCDSGVKYKIKGYKQLSWFKLTLPTNIQKLRDYGPFLTVIKISKNYSLDFLSGRTYKFDSASVEMADKQIKTHAVVITGYAIDYMLPLWEMMKSYGKIGKEEGFGYFTLDTMADLYSIDV